MSSMPIQKPGRSKQDYGTPPEFLASVRSLLGIEDFDIDLAASAENAVCPKFYDEAQNSLVQTWKVGTGWNWLNPPFARIEPWVQKALNEAVDGGAKTAVLVPASVGSNWWFHWVHLAAYVHFLNPRMTFVGEKDPYPKDLALLLYAPHTQWSGGYNTWRWR